MKPISIRNASEKNLRHISLDIPRNSLTVFTGVSGSGKSTLLIDVLYMECQRQYLEAMSFQGITKPAVERVQNASPAVVITQTDQNRNPRSTVGTAGRRSCVRAAPEQALRPLSQRILRCTPWRGVRAGLPRGNPSRGKKISLLLFPPPHRV